MSEELNAKLRQLRSRIDALDAELLKLLSIRATLSIEVGELKQKEGLPVFCPEREQELLAALLGKNEGPLTGEQVLAIYTEILSASRALQRPQVVACLGPEGTFSHLAGQEYFGKNASMQPLASLEDVFRAVADGKTQIGVVPLENSLQGSVGQSLDMFLHHPVHIAAEFFFRVRHSLLSLEERPSGVKKIYSHPQPFAQCAAWLKASLPDALLVTADSTAHAAELARREPGSAAIGHASLSGLFSLNILAQDIEDQADNRTRFALIAKGEAAQSRPYAGQPCKTTLLFNLDNKPGSLFTILSVFQEEGLNLSKLESRPARDANWGYTFFADVEADLAARPELLEQLAKRCLLIKVLGVYPAGREL